MRQVTPSITSGPLLLPDHLLKNTDGQFIQKLFNSLRCAVLYLDQWGRICSANIMAKELFRQHDLLGKTALEFLSSWDDTINCHQEVLMVARTGTSIIGAIERAVIHGQEHWFQVDKVAVRDDEHDINGVLITLDDITVLKAQKLSLQQSEARYKAFVENSQDAIWRFDICPPIPIDRPNKNIIETILERAILGDCNHVFANVCGVQQPKKLLGSKLSELGVGSYAMDTKTFVENNFCLSNQEITWNNETNKSIYLQMSANGTVENNQLIEIWGVTRDTTERRRYIDRLEYQANHDSLTGLPNRNKLKDIANDLIASKRQHESIALIIVDLDGFKEINDTLGHHVGDHIIREVGPRIQSSLDKSDSTICRLGGDEFAILLPDIKNDKNARSIAEKILAGIRRDFCINGINIELRASFGIALFPEQASDFSTLMRYADVAMYTAKKEVSAIEVYNPETDQHSTKRLSLMSDLGKAIRSNQLTLYYQPKISLETNEVVGVEALSRWIHPSMGFISPAEFIPIAEMTDMINEITEWVLKESLCQIRKWQEKSLFIKVAVNISSRNLLNDNIVQKIEWLLHHYSLSPACLELEITESTIMNNAEHSLKILQEINNLGIDLSIDDFGTGYSSLAYLKKLPVKWLKIDYAFIVNMLEDEQDQIIVNSTINMAHNLGLNVVAEGVENQDVLDRLKSMQCEQAQGYHISRPIPAKDLEEWYANYTENINCNRIS